MIFKLETVESRTDNASTESKESKETIVDLKETKSEPGTPVGTFPDALVDFPSDTAHSLTAILVDKSKRLLKIYKMDSQLPKVVKEFQADLGKKSGDKEKTNDHKTPTGLYFLIGKKSPPQIPFDLYGKLAFETNYPNYFDKKVGKTGTGIWLHAVPDKIPLTRGSRGCVVVRNKAIEEIEPYVIPKQTPLIILDEITESPFKDYQAYREKLKGYFKKWKDLWEAQDIDQYMKYYSPEFKFGKMNLTKWEAHKKRLKALYTNVKIEISEPLIIRQKGQLIFRFMQKYTSDKYSDYGEKTITGVETADAFSILSESWEERFPNQVVGNQSL